MATHPEKTIFDDEVLDQMEATHVAVERPVLIVLDGADINQRFRIDRPEIVVGRDLMGGFFVNDARCSRRHFKLFFSNFDQPGKAPEVFIEDLKSTNGTYVNGERLTERMPLKDRDKIMIGSTLLGFFVQDQYQMQADQRLLDLATIDALTGLSNRGMFNREFVKEFDRARRYRRSMALVIFDIDHFKHFNDTYGHPTGDYVLQEIGRITQQNIRVNDIAARYGGEEFAIILPETSLEGALIQARRLHESIAKFDFVRDGDHFNITVSLGIAPQEASMRTHEEMLKCADKALYQAKADGRDRYCWYADDQIHGGVTPA